MECSTFELLLDRIEQPVFCVRNGIITLINQAATHYGIQIGTQITTLLAQQLPEYEAYEAGELCLTLYIAGIPCQASVRRTQDGDLFFLNDSADPAAQALALSAQHLRTPLQTVITAVEMLADPSAPKDTLLHMTKSLYEMQRIVSNMSDTVRYQAVSDEALEATDLVCFFAELMEKAGNLASLAGYRLEYTAGVKTAFGLANREMLERAIYNLLANAMKFAEPGSTLEAKLTGNENSLCFTLQDPGSSVPPEAGRNPFARYLRQPGIEDGRNGIGLGLAIVRAAAARHGGTVLIESLPQGGTKICMTMMLRQSKTTMLRVPVQLPVLDYSGGHDHGLLELAEILPPSAFQNI